MGRTGLTGEIAAFASGAARAAVPPEAVAAAKRAFIDTLGVILAGRNEPAAAIMQDLVADGVEAFAWPGERRLAARDAAMLNGLAGHMFDYDDVAQHGHPSVVLVPAIIAEGQRLDVSGLDALRAYAIGYEVWAELAWREPDAYHLGSWHPTAMLGTLAATAALASLNQLDADKAQNAVAIAASLASGVIANFGSHMKPMQAGRAAASAIEAVRMAAAGICGTADAIEGAHGLLRGISPNGNVDCASPATFPGATWRLLEQGLSVKRYPVCYAAHRAIDGVIDLAREARLQPGQVRAVTVSLGQAPAETLRYTHPQDGLEARFSLHHNVAAALADGAVGFAQLADSFVHRRDIAALYSLTRLEIVAADCPEQPGMARFDRVVIDCTDGHRLDSGPIRYPRGHARQPMSDAELDAKFLDCARYGGAGEPEALLDALHRLDRAASLRELGA